MAHTCPDCGSYCSCSGDWDDIDMGEWIGCMHHLSDECQLGQSDDEEDFDDDQAAPRLSSAGAYDINTKSTTLMPDRAATGPH